MKKLLLLLAALALAACSGSDGGTKSAPRDLKTFVVEMPGSKDDVECVAWLDADTAPSMWCKPYVKAVA